MAANALSARTIPSAPARAATHPGALAQLALFALVAVGYAALGAWLVGEADVVGNAAVDRLAHAYLAWHGEPSRLGALGTDVPPLPGLVLLPFAVVAPLATSLAALPAFGAICGGTTIAVLDRTLARCGMRASRRAALLAALALNPLVAFHFATGSPAALTLALLALALHGFVSWSVSADPRGLLGAGVAFALAALTRYELAAWGVIALLAVAGGLAVRGAGEDEVEGSTAAFGAPGVAAAAIWTLIVATATGTAFGWVGDAWTVNPAAGLPASEPLERVLELAGQVFPLAYLVVPVLVVLAVDRRDPPALALAALVLAGAATAGLHAYAADAPGPLTLAAGLPVLLAAVVGTGWAYRSSGPHRTAVWGASLALLVFGGVTAWRAMDRYPYTDGERGFVQALRTGDDQNALDPAREIAGALRAPGVGRVLADERGSAAVVLLAERPEVLVTRAGNDDWEAIAAAPGGRVTHILAARGDALDRRLPGLVEGRAPGFPVVVSAGPYALVRVL